MYKSLDDPILLTLVYEPEMFLTKTSGDKSATKEKTDQLKSLKYIFITEIAGTVKNKQQLFYKCQRGDDFKKVEDYYPKQKKEKEVKNGYKNNNKI